ncbi:hypothetical protein E7T06_08565 [Deinococcus sp. Arct2-2]|uniref:hypothetical protein n=1 Tax=Deinococcus sp. Arct2-2 TaxID=2568653 RepID=UPI0010A4CD36|nr:hypothetical protein [Deinococcus sp. Arct2-2]THF70227.1 hypothetical protein E7T06_08565 [Deinococcus sp. Arct2-2]
MFLEERYQAAHDRHAKFLEEAATARLVRERPSGLLWWRRVVVWRPVQFTLHLPSFGTPRGQRGA